ncbi:MAG: hypothetical protein ACKVU2_13945 [Saprospiraceae bacterium]
MSALITQHFPTPQEVLALLHANGSLPTNKNAFVKAFAALYPNLSEIERKKLIDSLLEYEDALLAKSATIAI